MKERIASALRGLADKLAKAEPEKIVQAPKQEEPDEDAAWSIAGPVVMLSPEAEQMLADARNRAPKRKDEPEGPPVGSAWYRYLMASAKRESGQ
jgi:hypothetical protein